MGKGNVNNIARIVRNRENKSAVLMLKTMQPWVLYGGYTVDTIDFSIPILSGETGGIYNLNVDESRHMFFELHTRNIKGILAEKHLPMTKGYNFRDLGGIAAQDGRTVKWGKLFRSDDLQNLTEEDVAYLGSIPLISIIDLRAKGEIKQAPDKRPLSVRREYSLSIAPGNLSAERIQTGISRDDVDQLMIEMNCLFVTELTCLDNFREMFRLLKDKANLPLLYHCSAGKDRAGMATALILFSLGVSEKVVIHDYLLSKEYLADKYASIIEKYPKVEPLFTVKPQYLKSGINQIKKDHGSIEAFLVNVLNVDIERMRKLYLD